MRVSITRSSALRQSLALVVALSACADAPTAPTKSPLTPLADREVRVSCDPDNGGITLPRGFCAVVVADIVIDGAPARARHMAVTPSGDVFVAINSPGNRNPSFGIVGLRDKNGDGRADEQSQFSPGLGGSGLAWRDGLLFFGANDRVLMDNLARLAIRKSWLPDYPTPAITSARPSCWPTTTGSSSTSDLRRILARSQTGRRSHLEYSPVPSCRYEQVCGHSMLGAQIKRKQAGNISPPDIATWSLWQ